MDETIEVKKETAENKDLENIGDFFSEENNGLSIEEKWDLIFEGWINKVDQKKLTLNLFELKLWFESLEEFFSSNYLEKLVFRYQSPNARNYEFYLSIFSQVSAKIIGHLKDLDFKRDKYLLNFEEFIVENILERYTTKSFPYLKDVYSSESWFYSFRIFLQNLRNLTLELTKSDEVSQKTFSSIKRLYRKELLNNSIIISLLKRKFIPKMDKISQKDISEIINSIKDHRLKKHIGIFFIFSFRILKINNFIEMNLNKSRNVEITIPLILSLKKNIEYIFYYYDSFLKMSFEEFLNDSEKIKQMNEVFDSLKLEYRKIYERELPDYFDTSNDKLNIRRLLKNVVVISDFAIQELIENVLKIFREDISGSHIFENYVSRKQKSVEVKKKLVRLHQKINDFFSSKGNISSADVFFDINLFIETDLNYLFYKDWNEFLNYYNNLVRTDFTPEFKINLRSFHSFITGMLKETSYKKE